MALTRDEHELVEGAHWIKHPDAAHRDMWIRRGVISIVALIVIAGALGLLGVRSGHASQTTNGIRVDLTYPRVARPGLAVPFRVGISGLDPTTTHVVVVELSSSYADSFDFNNLTPEPESIARDRETITYEFVAEQSAELELAFDTRVEPAVQSARSADLTVSVDNQPVADLAFTTLIAP
jgi:hypothetical protein